MIAAGQILRLPFWPDDERPNAEILSYEVEAIGRSSADGSDEVTLIMLDRIGRRVRTNQGHFRRCRRSLTECKRSVKIT